jgi:hypothetical protein
MGMSIESFEDGVLTAKVSGQLTPSEWQAAQAAAVARMRGSPGKVAVLVVAEQFAGWSRGRWDDSPFQPRFNEQVDRMAIVGEPQWADLALMFAGKGLRRMEIEYFPTDDAAKARDWLGAKTT